MGYVKRKRSERAAKRAAPVPDASADGDATPAGSPEERIAELEAQLNQHRDDLRESQKSQLDLRATLEGQAGELRAAEAAVERAEKMNASLAASAQVFRGTVLLLLCNTVLFVAEHVLAQGWVRELYLSVLGKYLTGCFSHASWQAFGVTSFLILVLGRIVEEQLGAFWVFCTYIGAGVGSSVALGHPALQGASVPAGMASSGAVFGLCVAASLLSLRFRLGSLVQAVVLGQFAWQRFRTEMINYASLGAAGVYHLVGAAMGAGFVIVGLRAVGRGKGRFARRRVTT